MRKPRINSRKILLAEDDAVTSTALLRFLQDQGFEVTWVQDGEDAWKVLQQEDAPRLVLLDWMMPRLDGLELCQRIRNKLPDSNNPYTYVLLLTARSDMQDLLAGFEAGVDDYLTKPFSFAELKVRLQVGQRILRLEHQLLQKIEELHDATLQIKTLHELLPICMYCKKVRDVENIWHQLEAYLHRHSGTTFSHTICRDCLHTHYPGDAEAVLEESESDALNGFQET